MTSHKWLLVLGMLFAAAVVAYMHRQAAWNHVLQVPFNGNSPDVPAQLSFDNRNTLVTYIGGGDYAEHRSAGQRLRHYITTQLGNESDAFMHGTCQGCAGQLSHAEAMNKYQTSTFCLVLAGDAPSSRRATEVILHGCLPVYVGPPFNRWAVWMSWHAGIAYNSLHAL